MTKLTVKDLVVGGYFNSMADIHRKTGISIKAIHIWAHRKDGKISDLYAEAVAQAARPPLDVSQLDVFKGKKRRAPLAPKEAAKPTKKRPSAKDFAPRVKDKDLSSWILMIGTIAE